MINPTVTFYGDMQDPDCFAVSVDVIDCTHHLTRDQLLLLRAQIEKALNEQELHNVLKRLEERARRRR